MNRSKKRGKNTSPSFVGRGRPPKKLKPSKPTRYYESFENIMDEEDKCELKEIVMKHEAWLKETKVKDVHCDIVTVSCQQFSEQRSKRTPLLDLIQSQLRKNRDMFIIRLHSHCQTPTSMRFNISDMDRIENVDSVSYMEYQKLCSNDRSFVFRRNLAMDPDQYANERIYDITNSHSRSISNLKRMNPHEPLYDVTLDTSIFDFDFKHNWQALAQPAVQVENCGIPSDLTEPEPHYLDVTRPVTPMLAMPFKHDWDFPGISSSYRYYSFPASTTPMHVEDINAGALNQNLGPGNKPWLSCTFNHAKKMWDLLRKYNSQYSDRRDNCVAHFRKKADFIFATQLKHWDVDFKIAIQRPGDIVVTPTGVPHQVTSVEYAVNETINIIDDLWFKPATNHLPLCPTRSKCNSAHGHDYSSLTGRPVYTPHILFSDWTNYSYLYVKDPPHKRETFDYRKCRECFPDGPCVSEEGDSFRAQPPVTVPPPFDIKLFDQPHVPLEAHKCVLCQNTFSNTHSTANHGITTRTNNRKFKCSCGKQFQVNPIKSKSTRNHKLRN